MPSEPPVKSTLLPVVLSLHLLKRDFEVEEEEELDPDLAQPTIVTIVINRILHIAYSLGIGIGCEVLHLSQMLKHGGSLLLA